MPRPTTGRTRPAALATLALGAALAACTPGGDYGYDRVSHRDYPPEVPQATNPDPPPLRPGAMASAAPQKLVAKNLPAGVTQAMVDEGQELFSNPCAACHGAGGAGTPSAPPLNDGQWLNISGAYPEIVTVINNGVPQPREHPGMMPPKGGRADLTEPQVRALAAYVFALSHQGEQ